MDANCLPETLPCILHKLATTLIKDSFRQLHRQRNCKCNQKYEKNEKKKPHKIRLLAKWQRKDVK